MLKTLFDVLYYVLPCAVIFYTYNRLKGKFIKEDLTGKKTINPVFMVVLVAIAGAAFVINELIWATVVFFIIRGA